MAVRYIVLCSLICIFLAQFTAIGSDATELLDRVDKGDPVASYDLGMKYFDGIGVEQDVAFATELFRYSGQKGYAPAQYMMGIACQATADVAKNYEQDPNELYKMAEEWFSRAAIQGNSDAQAALGDMYLKGHGVAQDFTIAKHWYTEAAENREPYAMFWLGYLYYNGKGVEKNDDSAEYWFSLSAEKGIPEAQYYLGVIFMNKPRSRAGYTNAFNYFSLSAEQGHSGAMAMLGLMYEYGNGVSQDFVAAHKWYNLAGANSSTDEEFNLNAESRKKVERKMTAGAISEAQRLAREWKSSGH